MKKRLIFRWNYDCEYVSFSRKCVLVVSALKPTFSYSVFADSLDCSVLWLFQLFMWRLSTSFSSLPCLLCQFRNWHLWRLSACQYVCAQLLQSKSFWHWNLFDTEIRLPMHCMTASSFPTGIKELQKPLVMGWENRQRGKYWILTDRNIFTTTFVVPEWWYGL